MMEDKVFLLDQIVNIAVAPELPQGAGDVGNEGRKLEVWAIDEIVNAHQAHQVDGAVDAKDVLPGQADSIEQLVQQVIGDIVFDFQTDG